MGISSVSLGFPDVDLYALFRKKLWRRKDQPAFEYPYKET